MTAEIIDQIVEKLKSFDEIQQQHVLNAVQGIEDENAKQGVKIAVIIGGVDTQIQCLTPKRNYPDSLLTPAGVDLVDAVVRYVHTKYDLRMGRVSGKMTLNDIGSAIPLEVERIHTIKLRKDATEFPDLIEISSVEIREAIALLLNLLIKNIREDIERILRELEFDSMIKLQSTIILRGEFRHLRGLDRRLQEATGLKVVVE